MYFETSKPPPKSPGVTAHLVSPELGNEFSQANPKCLRFYYHMYGEHMGALLVHEDDYPGRELVWQSKSTEGSKSPLCVII